MDMSLKRLIAPEEEPQAGPLAGVPEGGTVITGGDSSKLVTAPEDLVVGQVVEVGDSDVDDPDPV